jgi:Arc/MetJ-type ribon-helix-helix transcriptional regulator
MNRHHVTLSAPVSKALRAQVKSGRYKDFSAAVQDAAWHYFVRQPSVFEEYGVRAEEVETAAARDFAEIRRDRKAGRLKAWKA